MSLPRKKELSDFKTFFEGETLLAVKYSGEQTRELIKIFLAMHSLKQGEDVSVLMDKKTEIVYVEAKKQIRIY